MKSLITIIASVLVLSCVITATACASAELTNSQKAFIDGWLADQNLNPYGDPDGTTYLGGSPLFDETTGQSVDRYQYVLRKHPQLADELQLQGRSNDGNPLTSLETELEMAIKDYQLELHKNSPDKARLEFLVRRIDDLKSSITALHLVSNDDRRFGILPEVFSEEVRAALDSSDYGRICELVTNLVAKGADAVKMEAEHLFGLAQQLRFRMMNESGDKVDECRQALGLLEPLLGTLKV